MVITIFSSLFLMVSFWGYCNLFYQKRTLPYSLGYLIFSQVQWALVAINLVHFLGWWWGLGIFAICFAFGAVLVTNFTTNQIYQHIFKSNPLLPLAFFSVLVWINVALTIAGFIIWALPTRWSRRCPPPQIGWPPRLSLAVEAVEKPPHWKIMREREK